jgi:hypothetical protein
MSLKKKKKTKKTKNKKTMKIGKKDTDYPGWCKWENVRHFQAVHRESGREGERHFGMACRSLGGGEKRNRKKESTVHLQREKRGAWWVQWAW